MCLSLVHKFICLREQEQYQRTRLCISSFVFCPFGVVCLSFNIFRPAHEISVLVEMPSTEGTGETAKTHQSICCSYVYTRY